ncbi:hypothetical protein A4X09_0g4165 [Tilletia walkeri]|uniref:non-specific serine/threonine protein kinase n=1 Tax=Tilletia walkeri TaxID=117179 RepID=A0A8X7T484_9BASI|nr:hypothetical protein A4X09_0g4165 [Tilletia walkeri]
MSSLSPPPGAPLVHVGGRRPLGSTPTAPSSTSASSSTNPSRMSRTSMSVGPGLSPVPSPGMRGPSSPASAPATAVAMSQPQGGGGAFGTLAPGTLVRVGAYTCTIKRYLSQGGFAHVYLVTVPQPIPMPPPAKATNLLVLKRMAVPDKEALVIVRNEVETHKQLRSHPYIAHFLEASASTIQAPSGSSTAGGYEIFILMEYCPGGGLIDLMNARLRNRLRESEILHIFAQVCEGVAHMHHQDPPILHRDLKVENILLVPPPTSQGPPGSLASCSHNAESISFKLCDFGSAVSIRSRAPPASMDAARALEVDLNRHTTLQYRAPEMVDVYRRPPVAIGEPADIWALGILLYKLCYYTTPFEENGGGPLAIVNVRYRFPSQPHYSESLKGVIKSILVERADMRPSIDRLRVNVARLRSVTPPADALKRVAAEDGVATSPAPRSSSSKPVPNLPSNSTGGSSFPPVSASSLPTSSTASLASPLSPPLPPLPARASPHTAALTDDLITFRDDSSRNGGGSSGAAGGRHTVGNGDGAETSAKAEMEKELRELEAKMDSKASMRRGRPTRTATIGSIVASSSALSTPVISPGLEKPGMWTAFQQPAPSPQPAPSSIQQKMDLWKELEKPSPALDRPKPAPPSIQAKNDLWQELEKSSPGAERNPNGKAGLWTDVQEPTPSPKPVPSTVQQKMDLWQELEKPSPALERPKPTPPSLQSKMDLWQELEKPSPALERPKPTPPSLQPKMDVWSELDKPSPTMTRPKATSPAIQPKNELDRPSPMIIRPKAISPAIQPKNELDKPSPMIIRPKVISPAIQPKKDLWHGSTNEVEKLSSPAMIRPKATAPSLQPKPDIWHAHEIDNPISAAERFPDLEAPDRRDTSPAVLEQPRSPAVAVAPVPPPAAEQQTPSPVPEEPFRGVSHLIARWQAHAENPSSTAMVGSGGSTTSMSPSSSSSALAGNGPGAGAGTSQGSYGGKGVSLGPSRDEPPRKARLPGRDI